jgi:hypothetical protein
VILNWCYQGNSLIEKSCSKPHRALGSRQSIPFFEKQEEVDEQSNICLIQLTCRLVFAALRNYYADARYPAAKA